MGAEINLSERSQQLIAQYTKACHSQATIFAHSKTTIKYEVLIQWLNKKRLHRSVQSKQDIEFTLAALRAELLRDLFLSMKGDDGSIHHIEQRPSQKTRLKFILLAIAGTLVAACQGFDSIITLLGVLPIPALLILITGLGFSILSVVVFYGFDLVQVSKNLGIKLKDAPMLLDVYLLQLEEIKGIRRKINTYCLPEMNLQELIELEQIIAMLQISFESIAQVSKQFKTALESNYIKAAKIIVAGIAGILFFGGGFFAGQSVALFFAGLFFTAVTPTFWPVIVFSVIPGLAALSLYWYVEQVGLKKLVSGWFGLDEDKVDLLCDEQNLLKERKNLKNLSSKVYATTHLAQRVNALEKLLPSRQPDAAKELDAGCQTSQNRYSFHLSASNQTIIDGYKADPKTGGTQHVDSEAVLLSRSG